MNKKIFKYILVFVAVLGTGGFPLYAKDKALPQEDFTASISTLNNPFTSPVSTKKTVVSKVEKKKEPAPKPAVVTAPVVAPPVVVINPPALKITGLLWKSDRPQAIINGKVVSVGEEIDGSKLIAVRSNEIDVIFSGKKFTLNNQPVKSDLKKTGK